MKRYVIFTIILLFLGGIYAAHERQPNVTYADETTKSPTTEEPTESIKCKDITQCEENLSKAVGYLKKTSRILKQERTRWGRIHEKVTDTVRVTKDTNKRKLYVEIEMDSKIKNEINSQPITRKYTLDYAPSGRPVFTYLDIMVGASYAWKSGYRALLGIGVRPFEFLKERNDGLAGLGIGIHTMVYNSGLILYYSHPTMAPMFFGITVGWNWEGDTVPGVSIGLRI